MIILKKSRVVRIISFIIISALFIVPFRVSGAVKPITDAEDKLEGISEEEKKVLEELFLVTQEIANTFQQEIIIEEEIEVLQTQIADLENEIVEKQEKYDLELVVLERFVMQYQRGGPVSYLEILLSAKDLTTFLKSINMIRDISRNIGDLLVTLEEGKTILQEKRKSLGESLLLLEEKQYNLQENRKKNELLKEERELYLASLQLEQIYYQEQLDSLIDLWDDCRVLFADIVEEITRIVGEGHLTLEDLNLSFGFIRMQGAMDETRFNQIIKENTNLPETIFHYHENQTVIEVPEKKLILYGDFILEGETAIKFEVKEGTFYDMPLEDAYIKELFVEGPLLIDFKAIAGDMIMIDFTLEEVQSQEGKLEFVIKPIW